ncbi:MAG: DNA polymerase I [Clostridia bacterium]|nr:DNA polymerase I [Clostridia bacterium]
MSKIIAVDGNSLMHRAYYALPSMTTRAGVPTGAVHGFLSMLLKLVDKKPDYLLVAFDMHGKTFRHDSFADYKAGRKATPDDLRTQFPMIKEVLTSMGITICECERYEADDILGTIAKKAEEQDVETLIVTGDKDALQLITDKTHVLLTVKGISDTVEFDTEKLFEKYSLAPQNMVDLKSLMGDNSDNIPGVPGVGEVTALKLLAKYKTLEGVIANIENEKGALQKKLADNIELARLSYKLGTINTQAPITIGLEDCVFKPENMAGAQQLMQKLELRSLLSRLPKGREGLKADEPKLNIKRETVRITDKEMLDKTVESLKNAEKLAIRIDDTFKFAQNEEVQYEVALIATLFEEGLSEDIVFESMKPLLCDEKIKKSVFDIKRIRHIASKYGADVLGCTFDAMIVDYLLHATHPITDLKTLCAERLNTEDVGAAILFTLENSMMRELEEKKLGKLYNEIELPLTNVLFDMEKQGFAVDIPVLQAMSEVFKQRISELEDEIYKMAGEKFNIQSTKQLADILFNKLGLPPVKKTKSGFSTDLEVLEKLEEKSPIISLIIEHRTLAKLVSTFVDGLINVAQNGRIHTRFNQNVTATGRISSTEPNLQNIPVRTALGREIRKAFVASEGNVLVGADYSQIELRLLAHMSGDETMIKAFENDVDIHTVTASEVFGVEIDTVTPSQRSAAKAVNFGIVYGISDFGLAKNIGVSRKEAKAYIEMYLNRYKKVHEYMENSVKDGRENGYALTIMGRRRELPEINSSNFNTRSFGERVAMNMPIQGSAADIIKLAMVRVHDALKKANLNAKLILQIHDELIIDTPPEEAEKVKELLTSIMQGAVRLSVPLVAEAKNGKSWFDTK